jgi:hypothetical protein
MADALSQDQQQGKLTTPLGETTLALLPQRNDGGALGRDTGASTYIYSVRATCAAAGSTRPYMPSRSHLLIIPHLLAARKAPDDFAGTGDSLVKGIRRCQDKIEKELWRKYIKEGRVSLFVMYSFPEALHNIREKRPGIHVVGSTVLGDELRACAEESGLFDDEADRRFARDVVLQLGRELYPDAPLGFGGLGALVGFHNTVPNNTLPIFWSNGRVGGRAWNPIFPRP